MPRIPLLIIALFFCIGGIAHFYAMDTFISIMPSYLEHPRTLVIISGVFELLGAIGVLLPQSRLLAAYGLMALCVAVFPANLNMALHAEQFATVPVWLLYLRLPLQLLFIGFIWMSVRTERMANRRLKSA